MSMTRSKLSSLQDLFGDDRIVIQRKKITAVSLNSDFFHLILMVDCLFTFHYANKYNILAF